jgi:Hypothetical chloroplast protein Ycf34
MCICLNCNYISVCKQYLFIENNHNELNNINKNSIFQPNQSILNINIYGKNKSLLIEWDVIECLSFKENPGNWLLNN